MIKASFAGIKQLLHRKYGKGGPGGGRGEHSLEKLKQCFTIMTGMSWLPLRLTYKRKYGKYSVPVSAHTFCDPSLEPPRSFSSNEGSQNVFIEK